MEILAILLVMVEDNNGILISRNTNQTIIDSNHWLDMAEAAVSFVIDRGLESTCFLLSGMKSKATLINMEYIVDGKTFSFEIKPLKHKEIGRVIPVVVEFDKRIMAENIPFVDLT